MYIFATSICINYYNHNIKIVMLEIHFKLNEYCKECNWEQNPDM